MRPPVGDVKSLIGFDKMQVDEKFNEPVQRQRPLIQAPFRLQL